MSTDDPAPIKRLAARVAVVDAADRLLMLRLWGGSSWILPGGGIEPGDPSPEIAALRELTEETGIVLGRANVVGEMFSRAFRMYTRACREIYQEDRVYLVRHPGLGHHALETGGREARWWDLADFELCGESCRPADLTKLVVEALESGPPATPPFLGEEDERIRIRPAREEDVPLIAAVDMTSWKHVYRDVLTADQFAARESSDLEAGWRGKLAVADHRTYVATMGRDTIIGFVRTGPSRDQDDDPTTTGEIYAIYLDPASIGLGVGRQLFQYAARHHRSVGRTELTAWALVKNARARRFYERMGCQGDGHERPIDIHGHAATEARVRRLLDRDMSSWLDFWVPAPTASA